VFVERTRAARLDAQNDERILHVSGEAVRDRAVRVAGVRSPVREAGPATAEVAVVFVHGNAGSSRDWEKLVGLVGNFRRAVALDMPGFGRADKPADFDYTVAGYARHLGGCLAELGISRVHLARLPLARLRTHLAHARHRRALHGNRRLECLSIQADSIGASIPRVQLSVETGQVHLQFGPYKGTTLTQVALDHPDYVRQLVKRAQRPDVRVAAGRVVQALDAAGENNRRTMYGARHRRRSGR
jgi:alpha/beta hydrolase fold